MFPRLMLMIALACLLLPALSARAQEGGAGAAPAAPAAGDSLPFTLEPAMGPPTGGQREDAAQAKRAKDAGTPLPVPPPDEAERPAAAAPEAPAAGEAPLPSLQPAMPAPERPATRAGATAGGATPAHPRTGAARPRAEDDVRSRPALRHTNAVQRPDPAGQKPTAPAAAELVMPAIPNVLPHFFAAGLLAGIAGALLLVQLLVFFRRRDAQLPGAILFTTGAFLFVLSYSGALAVTGLLAPSHSLLIRLATLAEALMMFGAGWWLLGWAGTPEGRGNRLALMVGAGLALSLVLLSPLYPATLLPMVRMGLLLVVLAGFALLLHPENAAARTNVWGWLALAGLFAWSMFGLLLTLRLFAITSASAVLVTAAAVVALAALPALSALLSGTVGTAAGNGLSLMLSGADAIPFHHQPATGRLHLPRRLARQLHLPADVLEDIDGFFAIVHPEDRPLLEAALRSAPLDEPIALTLRLADAEGAWRPYRLRARAMEEKAGAPRVIAGLLMEMDGETAPPLPAVTGAVEAPAEPLRDPLTGLPGQALLLDRLETALARARHGEGVPCLVIVDVDRYRAILDGMGVAAADLLIIELARRLQLLLTEGETVARIAGDQFALLIDSERHGTPLGFVRRLREALAPSFELDGREVSITVSVGVVDLVAAMALSPRETVRAAEIALFEARREGPGREAFFTPDMHGEHARLAKLEHELRRALKLGELEVHYQPIMWLGSRQLAGFEALVRWRHPEKGLIGPEEFIGLAEDIGMVREIGHFVLQESIRQLGIWQRTFRTEHPFYIAVNVASTDLLDPSLVDEVAELLARENADAAGLKLEVTESLLLRDPQAARLTLERIAALGVGVVCDDFGTGHSSLSRLRTLPFETLKIDRTFLAHDDSAARGVVAAVVELAHGLSMHVVAEGVEDYWQLELLEVLGCDMAQGYLIASAMDAATILQCMTEARRIAPFTGRLAALAHILFNEEVAPPLPEDVPRPQVRPTAMPAPPLRGVTERQPAGKTETAEEPTPEGTEEEGAAEEAEAPPSATAAHEPAPKAAPRPEPADDAASEDDGGTRSSESDAEKPATGRSAAE